MFGAEQTKADRASKLDLRFPVALLAASLTPQQMSTLRRVGNGFGLPAYVLKPRNFVACMMGVHRVGTLVVTSSLVRQGLMGIGHSIQGVPRACQ